MTVAVVAGPPPGWTPAFPAAGPGRAVRPANEARLGRVRASAPPSLPRLRAITDLKYQAAASPLAGPRAARSPRPRAQQQQQQLSQAGAVVVLSRARSRPRAHSGETRSTSGRARAQQRHGAR